MRPWEREQESPPLEDSPPRRLTRGSLSSMVVRLPENEVDVDRDDGGGGEVKNAEEMQLERKKDLDESPTSPKTLIGFNLPTRNEYYKEQFRGINAGERLADYSPKHGHGRGPGNPRIFPPRHEHNRVGGRFGIHSIAYGYGTNDRMFGNNGRERSRGRFHDFSDNCGQGGSRERIRDISPPFEQKRNWRTFHDDSPPLKRERVGGRSHGLLPSLEMDRSGGRLHNISPSYGHGSDVQFLERNFKRPSTRILPSKDVAPRTGDWFCENPSCANLNFARREYCYNCHSHRYGRGDSRLRGSPGKGFSLENLSPPADQWRRKNSHRLPPHTWTREHRGDFPVIGHGRSFPDTPSRRGRVNYDDDIENVANNKINIPLTHDHDSRRLEAVRYGFSRERKGGSYRESWTHDFGERSRSPRREQAPMRHAAGLFTGRGQGHGQDWSGRRRGALVGTP